MSANITACDENLADTLATSIDNMACEKILTSIHATLAHLTASSIKLTVSSLKATRDHGAISACLPTNSRKFAKEHPHASKICQNVRKTEK